MMINKLNNILKYVNENVPFYMNMEMSCFEKIPIVDKKIIKKNYDSFISLKTEKKTQVLDCLYEDFKINNYVIEKKVTKNIVLEWTTGSSGIPFKCIKSLKERKQIALNMWKYRMKVDRKINPAHFFPMIHTKGSIAFDIRDYSIDNITSLYLYIKENKNTCIHTTPNLIKRHIDKSGIDLEFFKNIVPFIETTGNYLSDFDKENIEKIFNAKILNLYGLIEVWGIAYDTFSGSFDILEDNVKIELLDENENVIVNEGVEGEVVITSLNQYLMPFIRYSTGDRGKYLINDSNGKKGISLCKDRNINMLCINGTKVSGTQFTKTVLRKIYWKKDFFNIKNICLVFNKKEFFFLLNVIGNKDDFEKIASEVIDKAVGGTYSVKFVYATENEFERINPKHYLFLEREIL